MGGAGQRCWTDSPVWGAVFLVFACDEQPGTLPLHVRGQETSQHAGVVESSSEGRGGVNSSSSSCWRVLAASPVSCHTVQ